MQRQVTTGQRVERTGEVSKVHFIDRMVDDPTVILDADDLCHSSMGYNDSDVSSKGESAGQRWARPTRKAQATSWSKRRQTWGPVDHTSQATSDQEWGQVLRETRRVVEFLLHRERKLDVKTDMAARRVARLERENEEKGGQRARSQPDGSPRGQDQCREVGRRKVFR